MCCGDTGAMLVVCSWYRCVGGVLVTQWDVGGAGGLVPQGVLVAQGVLVVC